MTLPYPLNSTSFRQDCGSTYSHYPPTSEWGVNHSRLKSQKNLRPKSDESTHVENEPVSRARAVSVWTKSRWQDLVRFGTFFAHFRRKMEIRKNFLDFACRREMRLMWRAFLYRGRGNGKRLDLIGFAPLQERGSASAGGVTVECVALLASPGPPPGGSSTAVVGQNCWLGAWRGTEDPPDGGHLVSSH